MSGDTSHGTIERRATALVEGDGRGLSSARGAATADEKNSNIDAMNVDVPNDENWDLKVLVEPTDEKDVIEYGSCCIMVDRS